MTFLNKYSVGSGWYVGVSSILWTDKPDGSNCIAFKLLDLMMLRTFRALVWSESRWAWSGHDRVGLARAEMADLPEALTDACRGHDVDLPNAAIGRVAAVIAGSWASADGL